MKPEDLMIGDWVIRRGVPEEPMRLYDIKASSGIAYLDQDGRGILEKFENIEPIPLTEEILYKNGFRKLSDGDWELKYIDTNYSMVYSNGAIYLATFYTLSKDYVRICGCEYVHELQNKCKTLEIDIPNNNNKIEV